jgi:N-acetylmuramoyl-L-alanine amidase
LRHHVTLARLTKDVAGTVHRGRPRVVAQGNRSQHRNEPAARPSLTMAKPLIVIDAGHGGRDSGAVGLSGTLEKTVTLAAAHDLQRLLLATGRYRVALTRRDDTFVPLGQRLAYARTHSAALLISLHADASKDRHAHGASVYVRSNQTGGSTVHRVAPGAGLVETAARPVVGTRPQPAAGSPSLQYTMIDNLGDDIRMTAEPARHAHLYVLAEYDFPSVLLEMGFLSNPREETLLKQPAHLTTVAQAIRDAINDYFDNAQHSTAGRT